MHEEIVGKFGVFNEAAPVCMATNWFCRNRMQTHGTEVTWNIHMDYISFRKVFRQRSNPFHKPHAGCDSFHAYCNEQTAITWRGELCLTTGLSSELCACSGVLTAHPDTSLFPAQLLSALPCRRIQMFASVSVLFRTAFWLYPFLVLETLHRHGLLMLKFRVFCDVIMFGLINVCRRFERCLWRYRYSSNTGSYLRRPEP